MEELEVADYVDTMTLGKKKVLAEIEQEADAIDDLWRHARETKYGNVMEEHTNLWRLLRRITEEDFQGRGWLQGLAEIETTIRTWTGSSTRHRHGGVLGHGGSTGQEPRRNCCIVDRDGPQDEVGGGRDRGGSQRDARAVSPGRDPGSCDPPTHRGNHSKSCESLKKIVQEFANKSTTGQEAMQIGLVEAGATAPTTAWPPSVAETFEESWEENGAVNAMGSQQCWARQGYGHVSRDCPNGRGKGRQGQLRRGQGRIRMGTRATTTGCTRELERRTVRAPVVPSRGTRKATEGLEGRTPHGKCYTCDGISHEIAPKVEEKEDSGHWKPWRLGKSRHWQNTYVFCHRYERHHPRTASAARTEEEVHDVCGHESQLQGWT